jgi:PPOX class probable FMN-dependent enzyme
MPTTTGYQSIADHAELRRVLGQPSVRAATKDRSVLHEMDKRWLAASPLIFIATAGPDGTCDVSPKGDPAGFVHIVDDATIAIPERPGNKRADGFRNILANPHVGVISLVPGRSETLRINGRATLLRDAPFFDQMVVKGHRPQLAVLVEIEQLFYHCGKAFLRSQAWIPQSWQPDALPSHAAMLKAVQDIPETLEQLEAHYGPAYQESLYKQQ